MTKLEKGLHSIHKYNDSTMNQQMKKILQSQTKINNRIQGECAIFFPTVILCNLFFYFLLIYGGLGSYIGLLGLGSSVDGVWGLW